MGIYSTVVRFFVALSVIVSLYTGDLEYSTALTILSLIYISGYLLIPKNKNTKYLYFVIDVVFISLAVYLTGYTYLSVLIIPLFSEFVKESKDIIYFLTVSFIPVFTALYTANFSEFSFIPLIIGGLIGIYGLNQTFIQKEKYFNDLKNDMENLYIKNISYQEKISQQDKILSVYNSLKKMRKNRFPLKIWIYDINEILGSDGTMFFDLKNNRCYSTEKIQCNKEILNFIDRPFIEFKNHQVNKILNAPYVYTLTIENNKDLTGIVVIVSKLKDINKDQLEMISDHLILYSIENPQKIVDRIKTQDFSVKPSHRIQSEEKNLP